MLEKLDAIHKKYDELTLQLGEPEIACNPKKYQEIALKRSDLEDLVEVIIVYKKKTLELQEANELYKAETDDEMREMAREEIEILESEIKEMTAKLQLLLIPKDPLDKKNIIMEIRAGTGGDEAALFAADLFRMYNKFSENNRWKIEIMSSNQIGIGGFKEIVFQVTGKNVYSRLKYESGTHRVQRVPTTESGGRIHTSAVTVAVLPEAEEVDIHIEPADLKFDVFRSSGPGGQSVNTTDSAVRITHIPTGIIVSCQDEKSQHKNKAKGLKVLRARLLDLEQEKSRNERSAKRKSQIGSGDRSERIRTYNFPQNRVTDHRIGLTLYKLEYIMDGEMNEVFKALIRADEEEKLEELNLD